VEGGSILMVGPGRH